jgi:hypothetical protein
MIKQMPSPEKAGFQRLLICLRGFGLAKETTEKLAQVPTIAAADRRSEIGGLFLPLEKEKPAGQGEGNPNKRR